MYFHQAPVLYSGGISRSPGGGVRCLVGNFIGPNYHNSPYVTINDFGQLFEQYFVIQTFELDFESLLKKYSVFVGFFLGSK